MSQLKTLGRLEYQDGLAQCPMLGCGLAMHIYCVFRVEKKLSVKGDVAATEDDVIDVAIAKAIGYQGRTGTAPVLLERELLDIHDLVKECQEIVSTGYALVEGHLVVDYLERKKGGGLACSHFVEVVDWKAISQEEFEGI